LILKFKNYDIFEVNIALVPAYWWRKNHHH
jgi:hypothetical protein